MREAAARCPECGRFFLRECITQHQYRVVCYAWRKKFVGPPQAKRPAFVKIIRLAQCAAALMLTWFFFFIIGETLLRIPTSFHEGTLWHVNWMDNR